MALIRIAAASQVPPGELREFHAAGRTFAVCNVDGDLRVFEGICPCSGGPLGRGKMFDGVLACPWHGMRYDVQSGQCVTGKDLSIRRYPSLVEAGEIFVELD